MLITGAVHSIVSSLNSNTNYNRYKSNTQDNIVNSTNNSLIEEVEHQNRFLENYELTYSILKTLNKENIMLRDKTTNKNYVSYCLSNNLPIILSRTVTDMTYQNIGLSVGMQVYLHEFPTERQANILAEISSKGYYTFPQNPWDILLKTKSQEELVEILSIRYGVPITVHDIHNLSIWDLQVLCAEMGLDYKIIGI